MPLVTVEIIGEIDQPTEAGLASRLADTIGEIFGSAPASTWLRLRRTATSDYAENDTAHPGGNRAVFVSITKRNLPDATELTVEAERICASVASICARPRDHVHVIYEPAAAGRIAFGGKLVR